MAVETSLRYWQTVMQVPPAPARRSTREIAEALGREGYRVSARTVQRDLDKLSTVFSYTSEAEGRTNYWFYPREPKMLQIPGMDSAAALALILARDHAQPMMPPTVLERLKPYFAKAESVLQNATPTSLSTWRSRVRVINRGPVLQPAPIASGVLSAVYEAVLAGRQVLVGYRARSASTAKVMNLHPLGIVLREGVLYLVASARDYDTARQYAVHRIQKAFLLPEAVKVPKGFTLKEYVEREFRYPTSPELLTLTLRCDPSVAAHLEERPLHPDQTITVEDGTTLIKAIVRDTEELRWWLLGFGSKVEVREPTALRAELREHVMKMTRQYRTSASGRWKKDT